MSEKFRILVTGSRGWDDYIAVARALNGVCEEFDLNYDPPDEYGNTMPDPRKFTVVHGACPTGVDMLADDWCYGNFFVAEGHPADWSEGRKAGPLRNKEMVDLGADICLAFISKCSSPRCDIQGDHDSHGATGCAKLAEDAGIPVRRFTA